ncbi:hypothetical protein OCU04_009760 [Sclerotinia nivalis]|uniref:Prenylcysteine lyase domain-containing protein n=1 Tax=Sclerotinia nivalis TaxID=352851 RepID=A0A9X0AFQ7_9HELO|nr:hypothetical protein OCU04_009760 [Sclerotinia nivalis]
MTNEIGKAAPPPYTPGSLPSYSEISPLIPRSSKCPPSDSRYAKNNKENLGKILLSYISRAIISVFFIVGFYNVVLRGILIGRDDPGIQVVNFKVGIIGAGPAGIAAAQGVRDGVSALSRKFKDRNVDVQVEIIIFEEKNRIGGRMVVEGTERMEIEVEDVAGGVFDADLLNIIGGMADLEEKEDLVAESEDIGMGKVGYFDTNHIITETYRPYATTPWKHYISLVWKYGPSVWRAPKIPIGTMKSFNTFLRTMNNGHSWISSVKEIISNMSQQHTYLSFSVPATERLEKNGIGNSYIRDILAPQVRRHTGQSVEQINDLALSMALEREEMGSQKAVNSGIFQMMMEKSLKDSKAKIRFGAKVIKARWEEVMEDYETWLIELENATNKDELPTAEILDKLIIATPFNYTELLGESRDHESIFNLDISQEIEYQSVYITFFITSSLLRSTSLKGGSSAPLPAQLLPIIDNTQPPNSTHNTIIELTLLRPLNPLSSPQPSDSPSSRYLYKLLTSTPLTHTSLTTTLALQEHIIEIETWTQHKIPYAYPLMQPRFVKNVNGEFQLGDHVWRTNAAEGVLASSVDGAWLVGGLVGRNVGRGIEGEVEGRLAIGEGKKGKV